MTSTDATNCGVARLRVGADGQRARRKIAAVVIATVCTALGCNESPYELSPVYGRVTIAGQPLTSGKLMFAPIAKTDQNAGKAAVGVLQSDGSFVLTTYRDGDGACVGEHWVTILGADFGGSRPVQSGQRLQRIALREKQTVVAGRDNEINFNLSADEVARWAH